jgi:hypothetical protein
MRKGKVMNLLKNWINPAENVGLNVRYLARFISDNIDFCGVIGIPGYGVKLEKELLQYKTNNSDTYLVVSDILQDVSIMERMKHNILIGIGSDLIVKGVVVLSMVKHPEWILTMMQFNHELSNNFYLARCFSII